MPERSSRLTTTILVLLFGLLATQTVLSNSFPFRSASVRATATVESPLGLTTTELANDPFPALDNHQWLLQYPSIGGIQLTLEVDGSLLSQINLARPDGFASGPAYQLINPSILDHLPHPEGSHCVVTLISVAQ